MDSSEPAVELSVVIPVYRCADCLEVLHHELARNIRKITGSYEIIFVDDQSPDEAWSRLVSLAAADPGVRAYRLSRNFGQHAAITAGLAQTRGRWTVVMDCDLQDPPAEIPRLYAKARDGYDVVLTRRLDRNQSGLRKFMARAYFKTRNAFLDMDMDSEYSSLSILSRKVVDAFLRIQDKDRQYMLIVHWLGFRRAVLDIEHAHRVAGRSSYKLGSLVQVAIDGMFFQTTRLLRWIVYLGFAVALAGVASAGFLIYSYSVVRPYPGWTSLAVLLLLVGGLILISTGVAALYIGKIFEQVKGRPLFLMDETAGVASTSDPLLEPSVIEAGVSSEDMPEDPAMRPSRAP